MMAAVTEWCGFLLLRLKEQLLSFYFRAMLYLEVQLLALLK